MTPSGRPVGRFSHTPRRGDFGILDAKVFTSQIKAIFNQAMHLQSGGDLVNFVPTGLNGLRGVRPPVLGLQG